MVMNHNHFRFSLISIFVTGAVAGKGKSLIKMNWKQNCLSVMVFVLITLALIYVLNWNIALDGVNGAKREAKEVIQKRINDFVENVFLNQSEVHGLGLAVLKLKENGDENFLWTTGYGWANREKGIRNGNETQFLLASVTKSFTSLVIAKFLHESFPEMGEVVLDTPINSLCPGINLTLNDRFRTELVTFRDLLAQRVCLPPNALELLASPFNTTEDMLYRIRFTEEICPFRSQFQFSNPLITLAAELIGKIAGKPFERLVQELLIELEMPNTTFVKGSDNFNEMPNRAKPYYIWGNEQHPVNPELIKRIVTNNPAGGLYSTPDDISKYLRVFLQHGRNLNSTQVVPTIVLEWLSKPSILYTMTSFKSAKGPGSQPAPARSTPTINQFGYGLGLIIATYDGWEYIRRSGAFSPYHSLMSIFPGRNIGIFSSTNVGPLKVDQTVLHAFIFETLTGNRDAEKVAWALTEKLNEEKATKENVTWERFHMAYEKLAEKAKRDWGNGREVKIGGNYWSDSLGKIKVSQKFNDWTNMTEHYLEYGRWYKGWLKPEHCKSRSRRGMFKLSWNTDVIQDNYLSGRLEGSTYAAFEKEAITLFDYFSALPFESRFKLIKENKRGR